MMCLTRQFSCGHDQSVDREGAQLFVRAAFAARTVGGLQAHVGGNVSRMKAKGSIPALSGRPGQA